MDVAFRFLRYATGLLIISAIQTPLQQVNVPETGVPPCDVLTDDSKPSINPLQAAMTPWCSVYRMQEID